MTLRIKITKERAEAILAKLPGGRELYMQLASEFIEAYENPGRQSDEEKQIPGHRKPWREGVGLERIEGLGPGGLG